MVEQRLSLSLGESLTVLDELASASSPDQRVLSVSCCTINFPGDISVRMSTSELQIYSYVSVARWSGHLMKYEAFMCSNLYLVETMSGRRFWPACGQYKQRKSARAGLHSLLSDISVHSGVCEALPTVSIPRLNSSVIGAVDILIRLVRYLLISGV
jgi:hypothetical protein